MRPGTTFTRWLGTLAGASLLLAACGGSASGTTSASGSSPAAAPSTAASASASRAAGASGAASTGAAGASGSTTGGSGAASAAASGSSAGAAASASTGGSGAAGASGSSAASASGAAAAGGTITIGELEDTSGGSSFYSQITARAMKVAIDEMNGNGGIAKQQVKLIEESDGGNPSQAPALVNRLIQNGAKFILLNSGSASAVASKQTLQQAKVVGLAPTNIDTTIGSPPNDDYSFMLPNSISDIGTVYGAAFKKLNITNLALLEDDSPTIQGQIKLLEGKFQGVNIVAEEKAPLNATDVTAQISRIKQKNPQAVLVASLGGQLEVLFQNTLYQQMKSTPRFSLASIGNQPDSWALAQPNALDGLVYISSIASDNQRSNDLATLLKSKEGSQFKALTAYDAQGYDAVQLAKMAIEKVGNANDASAIKGGLESISSYKPHFGQNNFTISFSASKHIGSDGLCGIVLEQFKGNQPGPPWSEYQPTC